jgi:RNA polymerase sigma factor (TIGR02999 family)
LSNSDITGLLQRWRGGDREAENALVRVVYPVLRDLARARLRRAPDDFTLRATELANETYARLSGADVDWRDRTHFFAVAARAIRNIIVDYVRAQSAEKRGGDLPFVPLELAMEVASEDAIDLRVDWLSVHAALDELELLDAGVARVVELKFFSGLTTDEIAVAASISRATVVRDWRFARAWLADRLGAQRSRVAPTQM